MELNKETLKQARRAPTPATHRAVLAALDVLDKQPTQKPFILPRWVVAAAAAATLVAVVLAVPPLRHRTANLALDVLGRTIPQADRVNPAAGGAPGLAGSANVSMFSLLSESPYPELPAISQIVGTTQTVNGITATVEEAALTVDKLYLAMRISNAPRNSDISDENMSIQIDGNSVGDSSGYGNFESDTQQHLLCYGLKTPVSTPGTALPVSIAFDLKQLSVQNGHQVDGALLASFKLDFTVTMGQKVLQFDEPAGAYATTAPILAASETAVTDAQATDLSQATAMAVPLATPNPSISTAETTVAPSGPESTVMPSSAPQTTAEAVITPMPSGYTARPKYDPQAEGWTVQIIALGSKTITMAAPSQLKRFDLGTPKLNLQASSAVLSKNNGADGVDVWPTPPSLLNDNSAWLAFFDGEDGVIQVMAYDPETTSVDGAAQKLDSLWTCGTTTNDSAGNEVTQFSGRPANGSPLVSTLLLYRLPDKGVKIDGKTYPFVIVRVVSEKQSDLWTAILLDCTLIN